jgi:hypothetical protein
LKKILLPLLLLFSVNFANADDILLDAPVVNLGYLESINGLPFNQTLSFVRTDNTPKMVDILFSYTQTEMICADRMPDGGGWGGGGCGGGCCHNDCDHKPDPYEKSIEKSYGFYGNYGHHGYDRNFMGICRKWTTMETQKSGRARLIFKKGYHNESGDIIKLNIHQRDLHSTVFWVKGWASDPNDYYKVINLDRTVIFK